MRFYDYKCIKCNNIKEFYEDTNDDIKVHNCDCGGEMKRILSSVSFSIKQKPVYWDLSASERKRRWNSPDPSEKI